MLSPSLHSTLSNRQAIHTTNFGVDASTLSCASTPARNMTSYEGKGGGGDRRKDVEEEREEKEGR